MKKKFLNILSIIGITFITFLISGCELPVTGGKNQLEAPKNISVDETAYTVSWDEVLNASAYSIYLYQDNVCIDSFEAAPGFSLSFLEPGIYEIAIRAIGDLELYLPSPMSSKVMFEIKEVADSDKIKLTTPANIVVDYDAETNKLQVIFDNAADYVHASGYQVYLYENDEMIKVYPLTKSGDYITLDEINEGIYNVKVTAVTTNILYTNSDESTEEVAFEVISNDINTGLDLSGYYASASGLSGEELEDVLTAIITSTHHHSTSYGELRDVLQDADEDPENPDNVILFYCRISVKSTWDQGSTWNREHVWPKSHGSLGESGPGADAHMLRASQPSVNSFRGNRKMTNVPNGTEYKYAGNVVGYYTGSNSNGNFEPMDSVKGDVARIYFYMLVRYPNLYSSFSKVADLDVMLEWNALDPVDNLEINRNEVVYGVQGNRNPFIDYPELADLIWNIQ